MHQLILTKVGGPHPYVDPAPEKVGVNWPPGPRGSAAPASYSNLVETMKLSGTVLETLSFIFQKLNRSRYSDHAPFSLSSAGWDMLWSTCTPNLKSLAYAVREISSGPKTFKWATWCHGRFVICRLGLAIFNPHTKFQVLSLHNVTSSSAVADKPARRAASRQTTKFLYSHVTITTSLSLVMCHPVARIDIAYLCTKFDDFRFSRSSDVIGAPKIFNGSHDLTTPLSGTVCRP